MHLFSLLYPSPYFKKLAQCFCIVASLILVTNTSVFADTPTSVDASTDASVQDVYTVQINTADAKTIASALVGVGLKKAQAIVAYREQNGHFEAVEDLMAVKGIGKSILKKNRSRLVL